MKRLVLCLAVVALLAAPAFADDEVGFGARAGLSFDPDQFVIGVQADAGPLFGIARFVPSLDLGFGDNITTYTFNGDAIFPVSFPNSNVDFYFGGGPALTYWNFDNDNVDGDLEIGLTVVAGLRLPMQTAHHYNLETRFGISDIPDVRILLGILFGTSGN